MTPQEVVADTRSRRVDAVIGALNAQSVVYCCLGARGDSASPFALGAVVCSILAGYFLHRAFYIAPEPTMYYRSLKLDCIDWKSEQKQIAEEEAYRAKLRKQLEKQMGGES